jgi:GNAT superfamily N-acetyltransferase
VENPFAKLRLKDSTAAQPENPFAALRTTDAVGDQANPFSSLRADPERVRQEGEARLAASRAANPDMPEIGAPPPSALDALETRMQAVSPAFAPLAMPVLRTGSGLVDAASELFGVGDTLNRPIAARLGSAADIAIDAITPDALQYGANTFKQNMVRTIPSVPTVYGPDADQFSEDVAVSALRREQDRYAPDAETQATLQAMSQADGVGSWFDAVSNNPSTLGEIVLQSIGQQAPAMAMNAIPGAGIPTTFASSRNAEKWATIDEAMQKAGVDMTDPVAVSDFRRRNPEIMAEAEAAGERRGNVVGAFDALSLGLAGRFFRGSGLQQAAARTLTDGVLIGPGLGMVGETGGQIAEDGRITSVGDILTEGAAEGPSTVIEGATNVLGAGRAAPKVRDPLAKAQAEFDTRAKAAVRADPNRRISNAQVDQIAAEVAAIHGVTPDQILGTAPAPQSAPPKPGFFRDAIRDLRGPQPTTPIPQPAPAPAPQAATPTPAPSGQAAPPLAAQPQGAATTPPPIPAPEPQPAPAAAPAAPAAQPTPSSSAESVERPQQVQAVTGQAAAQPTVADIGDGLYEIKAPDGRLLGNALIDEDGPALTVRGVELEAGSRGQGLGMAVYQQILDRAFGEGKTLNSDSEVTTDAARVYDAIERRGYTVERNPAAVLGEDGKWRTPDESPVFRVTAAPQAAQPAAAPVAPPAQPAGNRRTVTTAAGRRVDVEFQVIDASQLQAATGDLQNRDRTRSTSDLQIQNIAGNLDPQRLGDSAEADRGAPIVGPDGVVESGNGRVAAIRRAYESLPEQAEAYRQFLRSQGYNIDGMQQPVLVRRRVTDMTPEERRAFVIEANTSATARLNAVEQAKSDADLIGDDVLSLYRGGELGAAGNRDFVRSLVSRLPQSEQGAFYGPDGGLSQDGVRRVQNAMLARAYGDANLLSKLTEDQDINIRSIGGALLDVAGLMAQLSSDVKAGRVKPEFDISANVVEAAQRVSTARDRGETVQQVLGQVDAFSPMNPVTERLIRAFYSPDLARAAGREKIAETLRAYVEQAQQQTTEAPLFGDLPNVTPAQILDAELAKRAPAAAPRQQTGLFGASGRPTQQAAQPAPPAEPQAAEPDDQGDNETEYPNDVRKKWDSIERAADRTGWWSKASSVESSGRVEAAGRRVVWRYSRYAGDEKSRLEVFDPNKKQIHDYGTDPAAALKAIDDDIKAFAGSDLELSMALRTVRREALRPDADAKPAPKPARRGKKQPDALMDTADTDPVADDDVDSELGEGTSPQQNQRGRGITPEIQRVSFTNRRSWMEGAWRAAGMDPAKAELMPIGEQFTVLAKLIKDTFGLQVMKTESIPGRFAVDQLLDLYRNLQFMSHVMGTPTSAIGLRGKLTLVLRKGIQYLGAYYPGGGKVEGLSFPAGTVVLPKRSNSFAHEWMHALDHYLTGLFPEEGEFRMMSSRIRNAGMDYEPGTTKEAFVNLMNTIFFDQASLANRILQLQLQLDNPSLSATERKKAEAQLETLRRGNADTKTVDRSEFRTSSADFQPGNSAYWASPEEMLARAFEAYTAFKVEAAGGTTEALAKGDLAYLSDADRRLAETFPKGDERIRIFAAFDRMFAAMAKEQLIADGVAAGVPGNEQSFDPRSFDKTPERREEYKGLFGMVRETIDDVKGELSQRERAKARPKDPKTLAQKIQDVLRSLTYSQRAVFRTLERRYNNNAAIRELADMLVTAPGEARAVGRVFEEAVEQRMKQGFNRLGNIVAEYGLDKLDAAGLRNLRDLLISEDVPAPPSVRNAAIALRRFLDMEWYRNQQAGLDIGYARNGYLPRMLDMAVVMTDKAGFVTKAAEVYKIIFDTDYGADAQAVMERGESYSGVREFLRQARAAGLDVKPAVKILRALRRAEANAMTSDDPDIAQARVLQLQEELLEAIDALYDDTRNAYGLRRAEHWHTSLMTQSVQDFDAMAPDSRYTKSRKLPPQADKLMEDYYINDPIEAIQSYIGQSARRTEYATRFGAKGEKLQKLFDRMATSGVSPEDQAYIKKMVESLTGRAASNLPQALSGALNYMHAMGTMMLLPRAVWSSLAEPTAAAIRSGDIRDAFRPYVNMAKMIAGTADAKEWAQITRVVGAVSNSFADTISANRFGGTFDSTPKTDAMLSRFFQRTMLQGLTNAQRTSIMPLAHEYLVTMASNIKNSRKVGDSTALLQELGIADTNAFADWILQSEGIPTVDELYDSNGMETKHGAEWMTAVNRFLDQTIQNPKGYDRPLMANTPAGRLVYGILSFSMAFWANIIKRNAVLTKQIAQRRGIPAATAYATLQMAPAFMSLYLTQLVLSTLREAIFNPDRWEEWEKEDKLMENLMALGFTRSFAFGLADPFIQGFTGLKYQRDLSNIAIGAVPSYILQSFQGLLQPLVMNSEKTNNAEYKMAQSAYQLTATPAIVYALSMAPGGKLLNPVYGMGMMYLTAPATRDNVADMVVGQKDSRVEKREREQRAAQRATGRESGRQGGSERETGR